MNTDKKIKLVGAILGIILFIVLIVGVSYAWISWQSGNTKVEGTSECFKVNYTNGQTISNESVILFDEASIISNNKITIKNGMTIIDVTAYIDSGCGIINGDLELILNVTEWKPADISGNSVGAFKYALASYDPSIYSNVTASSLSGKSFNIIKNESITSTGKITLANEPLTTTNRGYLLIFYVDGDLAMDDAAYSTFTATITGIATQVE